MKASIYSNRLDNIYNQLNGGGNFTQSDFFSMRNNINSISNIYSNEDEMFEKYSKNYNFRKKMKKEGGKAISDFLIGMKKGGDTGDKGLRDRKSIIESVVQRNRKEKVRVNFDKLTAELSQRYNAGGVNSGSTVTIGNSSSKNVILSTNRSSNFIKKSSKENYTPTTKEFSLSKENKKNLFTPSLQNNDLSELPNNKSQIILKKLESIAKNKNKIKKSNTSNPNPEIIFTETNSLISTQVDSQSNRLETLKTSPTNLSPKLKKEFPKNIKIVNFDENTFLTVSPKDSNNNNCFLNTQEPDSNINTPNLNQPNSNSNQIITERQLYKIEEVNSPESVLKSDRKIESISNYSLSKRTSNENFFESKNHSRRRGKSKTILEDILTKTDSPTKLELEFLNSPKLIKRSGSNVSNVNNVNNLMNNYNKSSNQTLTNPKTRQNSIVMRISPTNKLRKTKTSPEKVNLPDPTKTFKKKLTKKKTMKLKNKDSSNYPQFKNSMALNKYLIRDFLIGEKQDPTGSSKKKMELTNKMYDYIEERKKKKIKKEREAFELNKYGAIITEDPMSEDERSIQASIKGGGHSNNLDSHMSYTNNHLTSYKDANKQSSNSNLSSSAHPLLIYNRDSDNDRVFNELRKLEEKHRERVKENSKKVGDMIENISNDEYEDVNAEDKPLKSSNPVNIKNLERVIRVRNIIRKKIDLENDFLGIQDITKFKENRRENDNELMMTLKSLGPPSFLKTRFRNKTIEKYKIVNGKYFGCMV